MQNAPSRPQPVRPFLKWAGGKQKLIAQYQEHLPSLMEVNRYYEPFIGSAALYFHLRPDPAILSDRNAKLIELYQQVQQKVEEVIVALRAHVNEEGHYYTIRAQNPADLQPVARAARLIYLNKTCYNGLFRENSRGEFNVPFGRYKNPNICDAGRLRAAAAALQTAELVAADFATVLQTAVARDFIYLDPPYAPLSATSNFTSYSKDGFGAADQERLAEMVHTLTARGCLVMLSNSNAPLIRDLYPANQYRLIEVMARRNINSKGARRGPIKELLILNNT